MRLLTTPLWTHANRTAVHWNSQIPILAKFSVITTFHHGRSHPVVPVSARCCMLLSRFVQRIGPRRKVWLKASKPSATRMVTDWTMRSLQAPSSRGFAVAWRRFWRACTQQQRHRVPCYHA